MQPGKDFIRRFKVEERGTLTNQPLTVGIISAKTQEHCRQGIERYIRDYPPAGYSTRIVHPPRETSPGEWEAEVHRYTNCD